VENCGTKVRHATPVFLRRAFPGASFLMGEPRMIRSTLYRCPICNDFYAIFEQEDRTWKWCLNCDAHNHQCPLTGTYIEGRCPGCDLMQARYI